MRAFRNMHSVTVLNVLQLRELSVSVAFVDVKEVKLENASLLGKCEELKRAVEKKKSDDVVVRVKDVKKRASEEAWLKVVLSLKSND